MPRFKFTAMNAKGAETEGVLDAATQSEAVTLIRGKGLFPTKVVEHDAAAKSAGRGARAPAKAPPGTSPSKSAGAKADSKGLKRDLKMPDFMSGRVKAAITCLK